MTEAAPAAPATFEPTALIGQVLDGRYLLSAHLATGGMGAVFRAQHVYMRKDLAIKVLRPDLSVSSDLVERFRREAEIIAALEQENIVRVTDFGRSPEGYLFLVMELLEGESLFERLRREGAMAPLPAVEILWQVCAALEAAHARGVVHRDLKPENVFLARMPDGREVAKILDFGIAKIGDPTSASSTAAGMVVGTPEYLSPEQALGGEVDTRADLYSVGLIAWRMLVGRHPFKAGDPRALLMMQATQAVPPLTDERPELAELPGLVAAVARACEKDVAQRYQNAGQMKLDLAAALPGFVPPPVTTPAPPGATPRPRGATPMPMAPLPPGIPPLVGSPAPRPLGPLPPVVPAVSPVAPSAAPAPQGTLDLAPPSISRPGETLTPTLTPNWRIRRDLAVARARALSLLGREALRGLALRLVGFVRARPGTAAGIGAGGLAIVGLVVASLAATGRTAADARALLDAGRPGDARLVLQRAIARRPEDPELRLLLGRALHRIPGEQAAAIEAYAAALERGPLPPEAVTDLVADLAAERSVADRAGRLLLRIGDASLPALLPAATEAPGVQRLRALSLARDLGAEEKVNRVAAYGALLSDPDCEIRRAAARRLGEIGHADALPQLRELAAARRERKKGFFGGVELVPLCGAPEAAEAVRRIEAARTP
ncbi:MAG TPA: protein kinase [Anaeromyxobacteraceae bacterium]|nr:protein kinase [Anaeromyxobacteraceae bacterium]